MPETLGDVTQNVFEEGPEAHKLHMEFVVATGNSVRRGIHVKMNATGEVVEAAADDDAGEVIGVAKFGAAAEERVTIVMRGFAALWALCGAATTVPGPVKLSTITASATGDEAIDPTLRKYINTVSPAVAVIDYTLFVGWALTPGDDDDSTLVVLK